MSTYHINGTEYHIEEYEDGFIWLNKSNESLFVYETLLEALQNAINVERPESAVDQVDAASEYYHQFSRAE